MMAKDTMRVETVCYSVSLCQEITFPYPLPDLKMQEFIWKKKCSRLKWGSHHKLWSLLYQGNGKTWLVSPCYWSTGHHYPIETRNSHSIYYKRCYHNHGCCCCAHPCCMQCIWRYTWSWPLQINCCWHRSPGQSACHYSTTHNLRPKNLVVSSFRMAVVLYMGNIYFTWGIVKIVWIAIQCSSPSPRPRAKWVASVTIPSHWRELRLMKDCSLYIIAWCDWNYKCYFY